MEFYWRTTYYPKLCVIQLADHNTSLVLDVNSYTTANSSKQQKLKDLLIEISQHKLLIFHSGRQDWAIFKQLCNHVPQSIIDIQYTGIYFGLTEQPSLTQLAQILLNTNSDNNQQLSDWRQQPLNEKQIAYARCDIENIAQCYQKILQKFDQEQIRALQEDSQDSLEKSEKQIPIEQLGSRFFGYNKLTLKQKLRLQELAKWREQKAITLDKPVSWICQNQDLLTLAKTPVENLSQNIDQIKSLSKIENKCLQKIRQICQKITDLKENEIKQQLSVIKHTKPVSLWDEEKQQKFEKIKKFGEKLSQKYHLNFQQTIGKKMIMEYIENTPNCKMLRGWRYHLFGQKFNKLFE